MDGGRFRLGFGGGQFLCRVNGLQQGGDLAHVLAQAVAERALQERRHLLRVAMRAAERLGDDAVHQPERL